jgi:hypothetical protein
MTLKPWEGIGEELEDNIKTDLKELGLVCGVDT